VHVCVRARERERERESDRSLNKHNCFQGFVAAIIQSVDLVVDTKIAKECQYLPLELDSLNSKFFFQYRMLLFMYVMSAILTTKHKQKQ
jgi:hypothetical protein